MINTHVYLTQYKNDQTFKINYVHISDMPRIIERYYQFAHISKGRQMLEQSVLAN